MHVHNVLKLEYTNLQLIKPTRYWNTAEQH